MKPAFERWRPDRGEKLIQLNVRVPASMKTAIELLADSESDTTQALVIEGLARVIEDREPDIENIFASRLTALEEERRCVEQGLAAHRARRGLATPFGAVPQES